MIRRLDHIAVVVSDTEQALLHFRDRLGLRVAAVDEPPEVPVRLTYLDLGNTYLQLVEPLDPGHATAVWLAEHGEGLHHVCFGVDDLMTDISAISVDGAVALPFGSGRGRPAGFAAGKPPHGVHIECTVFDRALDVDATSGWLEH